MRFTPLLLWLAVATLVVASPTVSHANERAPAQAGVDEGDGVPTPPRPAKLSARVKRELAAVRRATARFADPGDAVAAGYRLIPGRGCVATGAGLMGYHFVNIEYLLDGKTDALRPDYLLYAPAPGGNFRLVAVEYEQTYAGQPPPELFGEAFDGPMAAHVPGQGTHYDLHVWLHKSNPNGAFARHNPSLTCCPPAHHKRPQPGDTRCIDKDAPFLGIGAVEAAQPVDPSRLRLRLSWTHPDSWNSMDAVTVRLRAGGRDVGRIVVDQESATVAGTGSARLLRWSVPSISGPRDRRMRVGMTARLPRRLAGRTLQVEIVGRADDGAVQRFRCSLELRSRGRRT